MTQKKNIALYDGSFLTLDEIQNKVLYFCIQLRTVNIFFCEKKNFKPILPKLNQIREITASAHIDSNFLFYKSFIINLSYLALKFLNKKINRDNIIHFFEMNGLILKRDTATQISSKLKKLVRSDQTYKTQS